MGKVLAGGRINKVADGSTIYFLSIGVRVLFNFNMTFLAADFTVDRLLKQAVIYIVKVLLAGLINSSQP